MLKIVYYIECHCGGQATATTLDLSQPESDGSVHIDVELSVGCHTFFCNDCGCRYHTGDLDALVQPSECKGRYDTCEDCSDPIDECTCHEED